MGITLRIKRNDLAGLDSSKLVNKSGSSSSRTFKIYLVLFAISL